MGIRFHSGLLWAVALAGCFQTPVRSGEVACGEGGLCPDGLECISDLCLRPGTVPADAATADASGADAPMADAGDTPLGPFSTPVRIAELDVDGQTEDDPSVTSDLLELYFNRGNSIWRSSRASTSDTWGAPTELTALGNANEPFVLPDGLTLYFGDNRNGNYDIFVTTRVSRQDSWGAPLAVGAPINDSSADRSPCVNAQQTAMIFATDRGGVANDFHLYRSSRASAGDSWGTPVALTDTAGSDGIDLDCWFSADETRLYIGSDRSGGTGPINVWQAAGDGTGGYAGVQLTPGLNAASTVTADPYLTPDERTIFLLIAPDGQDGDIYMATR